MKTIFKIQFFISILAFTVICSNEISYASPKSNLDAEKVAKGWLKKQPKPLNMELGSAVKEIQTFTDEKSTPAYHIVYLNPSGFIIVSADDLIKPIVGFVSEGVYDPSHDNPLGALVDQDMIGRLKVAQAVQSEKTGKLGKKHVKYTKAKAKWLELERFSEETVESGVSSVTDLRVPPLVQSHWAQSTVCGNACYNYYTPTGPDGSASNYVCGCVATAMAQLMRFHQHPIVGVGTGSFTIWVDDVSETATLRGGDGSGGSYDWANMTLDPDCSTTLTQRQAIGALCYDAGISVNMSYTSGSSSADTRAAANAFVDTFDYSNAIRAWDSGNNFSDADLNDMLNPNLDATYPCLLGITGDGGHAIVCDGYGYIDSTIYHHLNMGWSGSSDAYYDLPDILSYDVVYKCVYNVYTTGSGEIISGRVTDYLGEPMEGVSVTAARLAGGSYNATTNARGIYALDKVPSSSTYTIEAEKNSVILDSDLVVTGTSTNNSTSIGNVWGVDLVYDNHPPIADAGSDQTVERESSTGAQVTLDGSGSYDPDGDTLSYEWTWDGHTDTGVSPTITLPMGMTIVTLTVSDGFYTDTDLVEITVVDTTPPDVVVEFPNEGIAIQDEVTLIAQVTDFSAIVSTSFTIREQDGGCGRDVGFENIPATYNSATGKWEAPFDSLELLDGYYQIFATAVDEYGNVGTSPVVPFSIRNWAVLELLPESERFNPGRTVPIKFSLRIAESVDPSMPFVYNRRLKIKIFKKRSGRDRLLQTSLYGDGSKDYRIDRPSEKYITNFKTQKRPATYIVKVYRIRNNFLIGEFEFKTENAK